MNSVMLSIQSAFLTTQQLCGPFCLARPFFARKEGDDPEALSSASRFGRQEYWDSIYEKEATFSWYSGWEDLAPFLEELMSKENTILLPGVGNDAMLKDMFDAGYTELTAFDYAPEGIERCKELLGSERIRKEEGTEKGVNLFVGDARNLPNLRDGSFDMVLEKGTLDAIIQSGGGIEKEQKAVGLENMEQSISELTRVIKPGGKFISISAICTQALEDSPTWSNNPNIWEVIRDGSMHITEDGFASNNFDGTLLAWTKL